MLVAVLVGLTPLAVSSDVDFVVMVDTSESMFTRFDDVVGYVLRELLTTVEPGDSFHLLTFDATARVVFSQRISEAERFRQLVDQVVRLDGLGPYTDLVRAIEFLGGYAQGAALGSGGLNAGAGSRNIILLTDGIHDPPPGTRTDVSFEEVLEALSVNVRELRREGWSVRVLQLLEDGSGGGDDGRQARNGAARAAVREADGAISAGSRSALVEAVREVAGDAAVVPLREGGSVADPSATAGAGNGQQDGPASTASTAGAEQDGKVSARTIERIIGLPTLAIPEHLGVVGRRFSLPVTVTNHTAQPIRPRVTSVTTSGAELLIGERAATAAPGQAVTLAVPLLLPEAVLGGEHALPVELTFAANLRVVPRGAELRFTLRAGQGVPRAVLTGALVTVVALVAAALLVLLFRMLRNALTLSSATRAAHVVAHDAIEMRVEDQSRRDRLRNVHVVAPGQVASVGGGRSTFLLFLHPVPAHIAEVSYDGQRYTFTPLDDERFPGQRTAIVDCIGIPVAVRSAAGHILTLTFQRYRSPLEELNELMRSVAAAPSVAEVMGIKD